MDPHITPGTVVYKLFVDKLGGNDSEVFVGDEGQIFYDPTKGDLRISNDSTPGGIPISQMMADALANNTHTDANGTTTEYPGANNATVVYNYSQLEAQGVLNFGNVKQGFQGADHFGWVMLDGRAVNTLTAAQQAIATQLGWGVNIPDATGRVLKMTGATAGTIGGHVDDEVNIQQSELPEVQLYGTADTRNYSKVDVIAAINMDSPDVFGNSSNNQAPVVVNLNPNTQTAMNVSNAYMALNTFAFLGL